MMTKNVKHPLVSIGMPIYNEDKFLRDSLNAITAQTYANIELLISDNASTDRSGEICREFADRYGWITYHCFEKNAGPAANFSYVLKASSGKYFMWAAGHDLWADNYIQECVRVLEKHPGAAIAYGSASWIDENSGKFEQESGYSDTRGLDIIGRYFMVLWGNMHPVLGLARREYLVECPIIGMVGSDLVVLSCLSLMGDFIHVPETQWSRREFRMESGYQDKLERYKSDSYRLAATRLDKLFPLLRLPLELILVVIKSKVSGISKLMILLLLLPSFPVRYFAGKFKPH